MKSYDELKALIEKRGVHPVFGGPGESDWFIEQNAHELATFLVAMQALDVQTVLELGTGWRAGLARFLANEMGWRVVSVDKNMPATPAPNVEFLMGSTEILRPLFEGASFDLVIIDADHAYASVKRDHELYAPLAAKVIMFHDIAGLRECEGARDYWNEVSAILGPGTHEIIAEGDMRGGIGWYAVRELGVREEESIADFQPQIQIDTSPLTGEDLALAMEMVAEILPDDLDAEVHMSVDPEEYIEPPAPEPKKRGRKPKARGQ